jgi:hypothetical protein
MGWQQLLLHPMQQQSMQQQQQQQVLLLLLLLLLLLQAAAVEQQKQQQQEEALVAAAAARSVLMLPSLEPCCGPGEPCRMFERLKTDSRTSISCCYQGPGRIVCCSSIHVPACCA